MVLVSNSTFLKQLATLCKTDGENKSGNSVWITMKRGVRQSVTKQEDVLQMKDKKSKPVVKDFKNHNKIFFFIRATDGKKKKFSTRVTDNAYNFMQEVNKSISSSMSA